MTGKRFWEIGGFVAGAILIAFGVVAIYMGVDGRSTVRDSLKAEQITFGTADDPAVAELDLNPVLALPDRSIAVDARVRVRVPETVVRAKSW